jgi:magnesium chelatase family protein
MRLSVVHHMLMIGLPGAGKILLTRSLPAVLPYLTIDEALDVIRIYSVADLLPPDLPLIRTQPFSRPTSYNFTSWPGRRGNMASSPRDIPGHRGVLFLTTIPLFRESKFR